MSFKKAKRRPANARSRGETDVGDVAGDAGGADDADVSSILRETMSLQKTRERRTGVTTDQLMTIKEAVVEEEDKDDPFGLNEGGGLVDNKKRGEDAMGDGFEASTAQMDDQKLMKSFVEVEMAKRYGKIAQMDQAVDNTTKATPIDLQREVFAVEEKYQKKEVDDEEAERNAEALSGALLTSVPEVDLGIGERLKTIEATEQARRENEGGGEGRSKHMEQYRFKSFRPQSEAMGRRSERRGPPRDGGGRGGGDKRDERSTDLQTMRRYRQYVTGLRR